MTETMQVIVLIITGTAVGLTFLLLMQLVYNWRGVQTYFNMIPRREILTETTWGKYTVLASELDASLYVWKGYDKAMTYSITVESREEDATISKRFSENDINLVIEKAYAWSVTQGLIKE